MKEGPKSREENGNGYEDGNDFRPQLLFCRVKLDEENDKSHQDIGKSFILGCNKMRSNDSTTNEISRKKHNSLSCDIKHSSCFINDNLSNVSDCRGYEQLFETSSIMNDIVKTKIEDDNMTDEIITCSIYQV